jgi:hypothetical protein
MSTYLPSEDPLEQREQYRVPDFHALLVLLGAHQVVGGEGGEEHHVKARTINQLFSEHAS